MTQRFILLSPWHRIISLTTTALMSWKCSTNTAVRTVMLQMQSTCYWQPPLFQPSKRVTLFYTLTQRQSQLPSLASTSTKDSLFSLYTVQMFALVFSSLSLPLCPFFVSSSSHRESFHLLCYFFPCMIDCNVNTHVNLLSLHCIHDIVYIITRIHELWDKLKDTVDTFTCNQMKRKNAHQMIWCRETERERKIVFESV